MIQVIERSFRLIERLASDGCNTLDAMSNLTGINKGTLCNILKTLSELGYVEKNGRGSYRLTERFRELCNPPVWGEHEVFLMRHATDELANELKESVVISTLRQLRVEIIAQTQYQQPLMVNQVFYSKLSLYTSVSGRVLCSFLPEASRKKLFQVCGAPDEQWDNAGTPEQFETATGEVRRNGSSVMTNLRIGIKSFAIPVCDGAGDLCASLGVTIPLSRVPERGWESILPALERVGVKLSRRIAAEGFSARNFISLP